MGGDRETTVPAKVASKSSLDIGDLRVHESKGQVHFHEDKEGLKVAVPVNRWYTAWERLRTELGSWRFFDTQTGCVLTVCTLPPPDSSEGSGGLRIRKPKAKAKKAIVDAELTIEKVKTGPAFAGLDKFTNG